MLKRADLVTNNKEIKPAEEIPQDPQTQKLGLSSPHLSVHDFELMRTLGTGELMIIVEAEKMPLHS